MGSCLPPGVAYNNVNKGLSSPCNGSTLTQNKIFFPIIGMQHSKGPGNIKPGYGFFYM